ncbi:MAG TPA: hypothetical protein VFI16_00275 [Anaeromyxobacteraceae bacterium]|nr:hypothetical protein [Anaeromyxobacteraceae bacterium]
MPTRVTARTAQEYAQALIPHLEHDSYRCDEPYARVMGKGCRTCGVEAIISIQVFRATGDLEVFEREMRPHVKKGKN